MDFGLSEDQAQIHESIVRFAQSELDRKFNLSDADDFPVEQWKLAAEVGLLGLTVPESLGGSGMDCVSAANALEALGYGSVDHGLAHAICTQNLCAIHIAEHGSDKQRETYLPRICSGDLVTAQAITEPDAGSDVSSIKMTAAKTDSGFCLNGSKVFITNGPVADLIIVYAVTNPEKKVLGRTSCFLVTPDMAGFERGTPYEKMGLHTLKNGELFFSDCMVPDDAVIGRPGFGGAMFSEGMNWERVLLFATFVGKLQQVMERQSSRRETANSLACPSVHSRRCHTRSPICELTWSCHGSPCRRPRG